MEKILVSQCLLGEKVRYDGQHSLLTHPLFQRWKAQNRIVSLCPEVAGGLPVPRPPAEIQGADGLAVLQQSVPVLNNANHDVSNFFIAGAEAAVALCKKHKIRLALLKSKSPSCGNEATYDGTFSNTLVEGQGVTSAHLKQHHIDVFNEHQLEALAQRLQELEAQYRHNSQ